MVRNRNRDSYSSGMLMLGKQYTANCTDYRYGFNGQEKDNDISGNGNLNTAEFWEYDTRVGRRWNLDPKPRVGISDYSTFDDNPISNNDPDGDCPQCLTAAAGALIGGIVGGAIEAGSQYYHSGKITSWKAVGGSALQGAITGGVAGATGGASLLVTTTASATANVIGGAANRAIQGKKITVKTVLVDAAVGTTAGVGGFYLNKLITRGAGSAVNAAEKETVSAGEIITTGTKHGTDLHWSTMNTIAGDLSNNGEKVYVNKAINTALGKTVSGIGKWKPDLLSINKDGVLHITEVISPSQTERQLIDKVAIMATALRSQGYKVTTRVVSESVKLVQ